MLENEKTIEIKVVRGLDDLMQVFAIRAAVFMAEQSCPFAEEFDGNDTCALHILGYYEGEPAGTLRLRFFGSFAKMERMAIRKEFRTTDVSKQIIREAIEILRKKGYRNVIGHAKSDLENYWKYVTRNYSVNREGFKKMEMENFSFSGLEFIPMEMEIKELENEYILKKNTPSNILNRPEGVWNTPSVLETGKGKIEVPKRDSRD